MARRVVESVEEMLRIAVEDEESEASAYYRLASLAEDDEIRAVLRSIAEDSLVHAEVLRGLLRALERIRSMRGKISRGRGNLLKELRAHLSIEILAGAEYSDLKNRVDVGSMRAVLEAIEREEEKHARIVRRLLERLETRKG